MTGLVAALAKQTIAASTGEHVGDGDSNVITPRGCAIHVRLAFSFSPSLFVGGVVAELLRALLRRIKAKITRLHTVVAATADARDMISLPEARGMRLTITVVFRGTRVWSPVYSEAREMRARLS